MRPNLIFCLLLAALPLPAFAAEGLAVEFRQGDSRDHLVLPSPALHVDVGHTPTPLLKPGPFEAHFTGYISVDLRAQYTFTAEVQGEATLSINGREILAVTNSITTPVTSKPVRLSKGTNDFEVRFVSPKDSPATLRILWSSRNNAVPLAIPTEALSHSENSSLSQSIAAHNGAFLVRQYRCANCHLNKPSNNLDAPPLDGIASRLTRGWIARWISDPSAHREARMPQIFHGPDAARRVQAVASYLFFMEGGPDATSGTKQAGVAQSESIRARGELLFDDLRCGSCHTRATEEAQPGKLSLKHVAQKFLPAALPEFLRNPQAHYPSNPMPNFKLSTEEANALAALLLHEGTPPEPIALEYTFVSTGGRLLESSGCLNCHAFDLQNRFQAPTLSEIIQRGASGGCLSDDSQKSPRFKFAPGELADIKAFLATRNPTALAQTSPLTDTLRYVKELNCAQCHQDSAMPHPASLGNKLKPEWAVRLIAGELPYKPRPWLKPRMPAFPAYATNLAAGLAALHGYPSTKPPEPAPQPDLVSIGEKLVSATGGFSCIVCHPIGENASSVIVESPGINLEYTGERLLPSFFHRWVMNPLAIDPATKMPVYFDNEARSQLFEILDGDAHQQIQAMWHYVRSLTPPRSGKK